MASVLLEKLSPWPCQCLCLSCCTLFHCTRVNFDTCCNLQFLFYMCSGWYVYYYRNFRCTVATLTRAPTTMVRLVPYIFFCTCAHNDNCHTVQIVNLSTVRRTVLYKSLLYTCRCRHVSPFTIFIVHFSILTPVILYNFSLYCTCWHVSHCASFRRTPVHFSTVQMNIVHVCTLTLQKCYCTCDHVGMSRTVHIFILHSACVLLYRCLL